MPVPSGGDGDHIELTDTQRQALRRIVRAGRSQQRLAARARIVLAAEAGHPNAVIARMLGIGEDTARKWRHRWWVNPQLAAPSDAPRSGRPRVFTPVQVAQVKALACQPPEAVGAPLSRWSCIELARQAVTDHVCASVAASTVRRWLVSEDAIKPWQHQSWIFIRDPDFAAKATRVLDRYARQWHGKPLGPDEYVISSDEKTSIQARCRCHPTLPPGKAPDVWT